MNTPTPGEREARRQHKHWAAAHARLVNGRALAPAKPVRARPESPFRREVREARERVAREAREAFDRQVILMPAKSSPHWFQIVCEVAKSRDISPRDIMSRSRLKHIVHARHEVWWRMRREILVLGERISLPVIGSKFGGMDHTTVLWGVNQHERRMTGEEPNRRGGPGRHRKRQ